MSETTKENSPLNAEAATDTVEESADTAQENAEAALEHEEASSQQEYTVTDDATVDNTSESKEIRDLSKPIKRDPPPRKSREERGLPPLEAADAPDAQDNNANGAEESENTAQEDSTEKAEKIERPMGLMDHLGELRTRLVRSFIAVGLAFVFCYTFAEELFAELCKPLLAALPEGSKLIFTALPEAFFVYVKVGLVAAIFVASPFIFYQIWAFVAPGLYDEEKKYMVPMAMISAIFFISGAAFCFFVVFPYAVTFFVGFASEDIAAMPSLSEYLGFSLKLLIAFGLIFEMPLFTFFLARIGLVTAEKMRSVRRYAILCTFIVAAILTPPDVISQLLMAMPMMLLYELSIFVALTFGRKKKTASSDDEADAEDAPEHTQDEKNPAKIEESA